MSHHGEILDSDDEEGDFTPISPIKPVATAASLSGGVQVAVTPQLVLDAPKSFDTGSTDSRFFQNIYNEHHAASLDEVTNTWPTTSSGTNEIAFPAPAQQPEKTNSSSLTDPTMAKRRARNPGNQLADLTQVTTPGKKSSGATKDPYDIPSSSPEPHGAAHQMRSAKKSNKRKSDALSLEEEPKCTGPLESPHPPTERGSNAGEIDVGADIAARPSRKRRRVSALGGDASATGCMEEDELALVTRSEEAGGNAQPQPQPQLQHATGDDTSMVEDTLGNQPPLFFVAPSRLTSSQRKEYEEVHVSSDVDAGAREMNPPATAPYKSSGLSTIAYTTPSRYASSGPRLDLETSVASDGPGSSTRGRRERGPPETVQLLSSPDAITTPASCDHQQAAQGAATDSLGLKAARKNKKAELPGPHPEDLWDSDELGYHRERYEPRVRTSQGRASRVRVSEDEDEHQLEPQAATVGDAVDEIVDEIIEKHAEVPVGGLQDSLTTSTQVGTKEKTKQPKKRGRKKKVASATAGPSTHDTVHNASIDELGRSAETVATQPAKKKRGRPRKSDKMVEAIIIEDDATEEDIPETSTTAQHTTGQEHPNGKVNDGLPSDQIRPAAEPTKKDNKKDKLLDRRVEEDHEEAVSDTALTQSSHNLGSKNTLAQLPPSVDHPGKAGDENATVAAEDGKETKPSTPVTKKDASKSSEQKNPPNKSVYRVGLSRKLRVAPLLKRIQK